MTNYLNAFEPYRRREPWHEDELTRAFLVVLAHIPLALVDFLILIREQQREAGYQHLVSLPAEVDGDISIETQVSGLEESRHWVVPILMTERHFSLPDPISPRDGKARYDGRIGVGDFCITIEVKPQATNVWTEQLNPDLRNYEHLEVELGKPGLDIPWPVVVSRLARLSENGALGPAEARLVGDFLEYVTTHFDFSSQGTRAYLSLSSERRLVAPLKPVEELNTTAPASREA